MGRPVIDLIGQKFGRLLVVVQVPHKKGLQSRWKCVCDCGNENVVEIGHLRAGQIVSCGCYAREVHSARMKALVGSANPKWKGGVSVGGYRWGKSDGKGKRVYEHREVMEKMIGRKLLPSESVHHKNGNRLDNRPENLELWVKCQPAGQRVEDLIVYAHEILKRYGGGNVV